MGSSVRRDVLVRMEECVTMSPESVPVLLDGWVQCVVNPVQKDDSDRTVPRNVSVTITASVFHLLDNVSAAPVTLENGARTSVQLGRMVQAAHRHVAVRTTANATTSMECVCVTRDTQGRHVTPDCVLRDVTASGVIRSVPVTSTTHAAATRCQGSVRVSPVGPASTATRHAPQDFMASPASRCASARMVPTVTV